MGQSKKKTTMDDIARQLNISKNAVSLALGGKRGVSSGLRALVVETARRMNYSGCVVEGRSRCVISIVPEYIHQDVFFYSDIFWSIEKAATEQGCISVMSSLPREAETKLALPQTPTEVDIVGYLVIGVVSGAYIEHLCRVGMPVVAVDISYPTVPVPSVTSSNLAGGFEATAYLIGRGHRDIGFIGPVYTAQSVYERWCGFRQAMGQCGLETRGEWNVLGQPGEFKLFDTSEALEPFLTGIGRHPTAWFCAGDRIAVSLLNLLNKAGVKVPDEVSIIGFDDIAVAGLVYPALTTLRVDRKLMGRLAFEALLDKRRQEKHIISIPTVLVERDSVRAWDAALDRA